MVPDESSPFTIATKFSEWQSAMPQEYQVLMKTNTWTLVPPSSASNLVGCRWIFRTKLHSNGSIERRKAKLVAKGFHQ